MGLLEKHFDLAFAAPDGIKKLRELILTLAMQGKLVPQDSNDQPASELLKEIEAEKKRLVTEGKIKEQNPQPKINLEEMPYKLPRGWEWCRWNDVALKIGDVDHKMPVEVTQGVPYVSPRDFFGKNEIAFEQAKKISIQDFEMLRLKIQPEKFDIIFPRYGTLGVNRFVLVDIDFLASYSCAVIKSFKEFIEPKYSYYYSISQLVRTEIERYTKKTTQANVGVKSIQIFLYPLPPLAEQRRIVAKIDELMARCDELEKLRSDRTQKRITVHTAALNRLMMAKDSSDFSTAWGFITQHFSELYSVKENVAELRKAILQLAVMGKLVPQDPNDQPASELLNAIGVEKERLVKEGKIKTQKPLPNINLEDLPYELPKMWKWVRIDSLCLGITSGSTPPNHIFSDKEGIPFLKVYNIRNQKLDFQYKPQFIDKEYHLKSKRSCLKPGDVIMNIVGPPLGKVAIIPDDFSEYNCNQALVFFRPVVKSLNNYLYLYLLSGKFLDKIELIGTAGQDNISVTKSRSILVPLPPFAEQRRIVAKIEQLMTLCDNLEQQIDNANSKQTDLLNAVMAQV